MRAREVDIPELNSEYTVLMSHFCEAFLLEFFSTSRTMMPVTNCGVRAVLQRRVTWYTLAELLSNLHGCNCLRLTVLQLFQMFRISKGMAG